MESLTIPALPTADNATSQEKINAIPFAERSKVEVSIFEDGATAWRMEKQIPKHDLRVQHKTPPTDVRDVSVTTIDRTGMGRFYDHQKNLLFSQPVPVSSFLDVVLNLKENPNAIFTVMGINTAAHVNQLITQAKARGQVVQDMGNNIVSVRTGNGSVGAGQARPNGEDDNFTTVDIFNVALGIKLGSTMYDELGNTVCQVFYKYGYNAEGQLVPEATYLQTWDKDPVTGALRKTETNTWFENVTATININ